MNDVTNAGVDWTLSCDSPGECGTIDAHTASGTAATYTAPDSVHGSGQVTIHATSTADKSASASQAVTVTAPSAITGTVISGHAPVVGTAVTLYVAGTSGYGSESTPINSDAGRAVTDGSGSFSIPAPFDCPSPSSQLYVVARGGNAGGGQNPNLVFMGWVGKCNALGHGGNISINEITTVVSAYALAQFTRDATHLGAPPSNTNGLSEAGALINDLADPVSGVARAHTLRNHGQAPTRQIDTLANILHLCAATGGGAPGDGSPCGDLFLIADGSPTADTLQAALSIAHHPSESSLELLFALFTDADPYRPVSDSPPANWTLAIIFSPDAFGTSSPMPPRLPWVDAAGNNWSSDPTGTSIIESIGASHPPKPPIEGTQP
jgi:hypothetical protein